MVFGGYRVTFTQGDQPIFLQVAWPTNSDPRLIKERQDRALAVKRDSLTELALISIEQREHDGITYELQLYGKPGAYVAGPVTELK